MQMTAVAQSNISQDEKRNGYLSPTGNRSTDHQFVSNVRFLAMAAVVCQHCIQSFAPLVGIESNSPFSALLVQPCKFGTIGFFLISGFLMGEGLTRRTRAEYLKRRLHTVFVPWFAWFFLFWIPKRTFLDPQTWKPLNLLRRTGEILFSSTYWFVPNLLLAICILLIFRSFLRDFRFGLIWLALSIFYGLNVYRQWLPVASHSQALLGFVFYLWLGAWTAQHYADVGRWIESISTAGVIMVCMVAFGGSLGESALLAHIRPSDDLDTLRLTNQVYSIAMVLLIVKLRRAIWPRWIDVRGTTFGIYLAHPPLIAALQLSLAGATPVIAYQNPSTGLACLIASFAVIYGMSLLVTVFILKRQHLGWMVGGRALRSS